MTKTYQKTMLNDQKPEKQNEKKQTNINDQNIPKKHVK